MVDAAGRLTHYVSVQSDVTALLEAPEHEAARAVEEAVGARTRELEAALARVEERRRFTETILNAMVSAILATDAEGNGDVREPRGPADPRHEPPRLRGALGGRALRAPRGRRGGDRGLRPRRTRSTGSTFP